MERRTGVNDYSYFLKKEENTASEGFHNTQNESEGKTAKLPGRKPPKPTYFSAFTFFFTAGFTFAWL
jgi:hypothetical protein